MAAFQWFLTAFSVRPSSLRVMRAAWQGGDAMQVRSLPETCDARDVENQDCGSKQKCGTGAVCVARRTSAPYNVQQSVLGTELFT
jgi:hypothetical protein